MKIIKIVPKRLLYDLNDQNQKIIVILTFAATVSFDHFYQRSIY